MTYLHDPFDPDAARKAAADVAYPDDLHGVKVGRQWPETTPVTVRGVANVVDMTWQDDTAACIGHPVDWWFPADKVNATIAKQICQTCPLIEPCAAHGIKHEIHGVWGGLTSKERRQLRGKGAGRPLSPIIHGTRAGYEKHRRHPEVYGPTSQCQPCRQANHMASRDRKSTRLNSSHR